MGVSMGVCKSEGSDATPPSHLLVLVHGILGSPNEWKNVERVLKKSVGPDILVFSSKCNTHLLSLQGIDVAGRRLAEEVRDVVAMTPGLAKISFVGHSLGGLVARYAVALLLDQPADEMAPRGEVQRTEEEASARECGASIGVERDDATGCSDSGSPQRADATTTEAHPDPAAEAGCCKGCAEPDAAGGGRPRMAGLEPVNFITLASPHLGVRGNKQLPFLLGVQWFERFAPPLAPLIVGHTGRQLFLSDGEDSQPPLLVRMTYDCPEAPFISALRAFQLRVAYANAGCDHMVGWRTSSIRREEELPKLPKFSFLPRFQKVLNVQDCPAVLPPQVPARPYPPVGAAALALLQAQNALRIRRPREVVAHLRSSSAVVFGTFPIARGTLRRSLSFGKPAASFGKLRWLSRASFSFGAAPEGAGGASGRGYGRGPSSDDEDEREPVSPNGNGASAAANGANGGLLSEEEDASHSSSSCWGGPEESKDAGISSSSSSCFSSKEAAHRFLEEEMVTGLQQVPWRKIDASLREVLRPWYAHHNVHNWAVRTPHELANFAALLASAGRGLSNGSSEPGITAGTPSKSRGSGASPSPNHLEQHNNAQEPMVPTS